MRILITGGLGFIGSHLTVRLLNEGHKVIILDNRVCNTDYLEYLQLMKHRRLTIKYHDVNYPIKSISADQVYHFACPASPSYFMFNKMTTMLTSSYGTYNVIVYACKQKARIFIASSSEVYGNAQMHPQDEEYTGSVSVTSERACYSEGKRAAETWASLYANSGHDIRIGRIFNTYGPGMTVEDGRVVPCFVTAAICGKDLYIHGNGTQTRSFCYIDDMVEVIMRLMNSNIMTPVNLGNPYGECSIQNIAASIIQLTGSRSTIKKIAPPYDSGTETRCPDITKASHSLQWEPQVSLPEGLQKTIDWYKKKIV